MSFRQLVAPFVRKRYATLRVGEMPKEALRRRIDARARLVIRADKGTNYRFTRYGPGGNSPHQLGSEIYLKTGDVGAVETFLHRFISEQRPSSLSELLFGCNAPEYKPLDTLSPLVKFQPWHQEKFDTVGFVGQREASFGAVSDQHVRAEARKQAAAVDSLRKNGYEPEMRRRGYLMGRILLSRGDYRFLVEDGKHRLGALNALGAGEIAVRFNPHGPAVVDEDEVDAWPMVASGACPRDLAIRLLRRHFN